MNGKDIVCASGELTAAVAELKEYADFLNKSINSYIRILGGIQGDAIQDNLICARLSAIAEALRPYQQTIAEASESVSSQVNDYIAEIERADNFVFPGDFSSAILSVVSKFL